MTAYQSASALAADACLDVGGDATGGAPTDVVEIHPLLHQTLSATRPSWQDHADVAIRLDDRVSCVQADARQLARTCARVVLDVVGVIRERDGCPPARRGRLVVSTTRRAQRIEVSVGTDGFRHVLRLPAVD